MILVLIFIIIILAIAVLGLAVFAYREAKKHGTRAGEEFAGICARALDQTVRKNANKNKALEFIRARGSVSNEDIREYLGVSRRSAARYMDALEKEGKVEQVGDIGRGVSYRAK